MTTLTIRNLDPALKEKLRVTAAEHGRSMEEEVRTILRNTLNRPDSEVSGGLGSRIHARFAELGGVELAEPRRHEDPRAAGFEGVAEDGPE